MSGFHANFDGPGQAAGLNLSTNASRSTKELMAEAQRKRRLRNELAKQAVAARKIQRAWRTVILRRAALLKVLEELEDDTSDWRTAGYLLANLLPPKWTINDTEEVQRRIAALVKWSEGSMVVVNEGASPGFIELLRSIGHRRVLPTMMSHVLMAISYDPTNNASARLLAVLETYLAPTSWANIADDSGEKEAFLDMLASISWVETLVSVLETLVKASLPKKKHPNIEPLIRLLTGPMYLTESPTPQALLEPLVNQLLAFPSLPSVLPIASLAHLSSKLGIFSVLLPLASQPISDPALSVTSGTTWITDRGRMNDEGGKTHFLANLLTFGVQSGRLPNLGPKWTTVWMRTINHVLSGMETGWGRWLAKEEVQPQVVPIVVDSDSDSDAGPSTRATSQPRKPKREVLPKAVRDRLLLLPTAKHIGPLAKMAIARYSATDSRSKDDFAMSARDAIAQFSELVSSLLRVFRGTTKWELVLETLLYDTSCGGLIETLYRGTIRPFYTVTGLGEASGWQTLAAHSNTPNLVLMTLLYNHYLLITPDDQFFDANSNPLSADDIVHLAGSLKSFASDMYTIGVAPPMANVQQDPRPKEEVRSWITLCLTRLAERNARRQFLPDGFWVHIHSSQIHKFVQAAIYEDEQLSNQDGGDDDQLDTDDLPRWARQRRRYTRKQLAHSSPALGILNNVPMIIPFTTRLQVFRNFIAIDKHRLGLDMRRRRGRGIATIHRDNLAEDGFRQMNDLGPMMKADIQVEFIDKWGNTEAGIDGGGLYKEFLTSLSKEVFDTDRGLWLATDQNQLYPNPSSYATEAHQLQWFAFIGRVLGKALYDGILVDVSFADFFLAKWLGRQSYLDDLRSLDAELYRGLLVLKNDEKPEQLALTFSIDEEDFDMRKTVDLVPNGSEIPVTAENKHEYIQLICKHKLDRQIAKQSKAFFDGLSDLIDSKWLRMFDQRELRELIGGEDTPIDMDDLREHTSVTGFMNDKTMKLFWKVVKNFSQEERKALLRFVTSCSRPPLLGFQHLNPMFGVRYGGADTSRLPSASSCFNLLKLPGYEDEDLLREKLLQAITSGVGFDLS